MRGRTVLWLDANQKEAAPEAPSYFRRELGLNPVTLCGIDFEISRTAPLLAFVHVEPRSLLHLRDLPPRSVQLLVASDETYRIDLLEAITRTPAISQVFRCYPLFGSSRQPLARRLVVAASEARGLDMRAIRPALRAVVAGGVMERRVGRWTRQLEREGIGVTPLCLGYTDWFERGLAALAREEVLPQLPAEGSLIPYFTENADRILTSKSDELGFVGQLGSFQRQAGIRAAQKAGFPVGPVRDGFAGGRRDPALAAHEYVQQLLTSRFTLCPPGNYSGESFRLTEACLLLSVPVEAFPTLSDPFRPAFGEVAAPGIVASSWSKSLGIVTQLSDSAWKGRALGSLKAISAAFTRAREAVLTTA